MRLYLQLFICLTMISGVLGCSSQEVDIPDPNLRAAIEAELGKPAGTPITAAEMATLTEFSAPISEIDDLTGLEFATNLTHLILEESNLTALSPLAGLTNLTLLNLSHSSIRDISVLSGLTNLTVLELQINTIKDLSPLAGLTQPERTESLEQNLEENGTVQR